MKKVICHSTLSKKFSTRIRSFNEISPFQKKIIIDGTIRFERNLNKTKQGKIGEEDREIVFYVTQDNADFEIHLSYLLLAEIRNSKLYKTDNKIGLDAGNTFLIIKKGVTERL